MVEFDEKTSRIRIGDRDYGPIKKGDMVDYGLGRVLVNGRPRSSVAAPPRVGIHRYIPNIPITPEGPVTPQ